MTDSITIAQRIGRALWPRSVLFASYMNLETARVECGREWVRVVNGDIDLASDEITLAKARDVLRGESV